MMALQARSTAEIKADGSWALKTTFDLSAEEYSRDMLGEDLSEVGGMRELHFQPGVSAGSSRREIIRSLVCRSSGRRRRVIENPGMFRLVFSVLSHQLPGYGHKFQTYHESSRKKPLN